MPVPKRLLLAVVLTFTSAARADDLASSMKQLERLRGVTFASDVAQTTIDRKDLRLVLRRELAKSLPYSTEDYSAVLRALQLVDAAPGDLMDQMLDLYEQQVLAFYDPLSHTYFAIKQMPPAMAALGDSSAVRQSVVMHELTHALQDQRFQASERDRALLRDADAELAYHSLLEGEASLVMLGWLMDKSGQSLDSAVKNDAMVNMMAASAAADKSIDKSTPRYFIESLKFPYLEGLKLVIAGYRRGGWKQIDQMHANPPQSTREILHPDEYFARLDAKQPGTPTPDLRPATADTRSIEHLGEFHWRFFVGDAATGWIDDRVIVSCDDRVAIWTRWENESRAAAFRDAYVAFLRGRGIEPWATLDGATVSVVYQPL